MCAARLQAAVDAHAKTLVPEDGCAVFAMGVYADLQRGAQPDLAGLAALEPLLTLILKAAPRAIVNQKALAATLAQALLFLG